MSHLRLYEHPANRRLFGVGVPQLYISGTLPDAKPFLAYEGRLQIVNAGGPCSVELLSGTLPPGSTVTVDNDTKQIVIAWPAYEASAISIPNYGFESGDAGWEFGAGWSVTEDNPVTGARAAQYLDNSGDSIIANAVRAAIAPGTPITATCSVRQGASSSGNAGACVRLEFFDADGEALAPQEGNMISQGSNNVVQSSTVVTTAPSNSATVRIASRGFRKRQNKKVWVDDFHWNVTQPSVGVNEEAVYCITLRTRDALGRQADWSGCIIVSPANVFIVCGNSVGSTQNAYGRNPAALTNIPDAEIPDSSLTMVYDNTINRWIGVRRNITAYTSDPSGDWFRVGNGAGTTGYGDNHTGDSGEGVSIFAGTISFSGSYWNRSTDGGITLTRMANDNGVNYAYMRYLGNSNWVVSDANRRVFTSANNGGSWSTRNISGLGSTVVDCLDHNGAGTVIAASGATNLSYVVKSIDYGVTWSILFSYPSRIQTIAHGNAQEWAAVAANGDVLTTDDNWATYTVHAGLLPVVSSWREARHNGQFYLFPAGSLIYYSEDRLVWNSVNPNVGGIESIGVKS